MQSLSRLKHVMKARLDKSGAWLIYPDSRLDKTWRVIVMLSGVVLCVTVSYVIAYSGNVPYAMVLIHLAWSIQLLDIAANFRTSFIDEEGQKVKNNLLIAKSYLRSRFMIDVLCTFPLNWFSSNASTSKFLLCNRILSLYKALIWIRSEEKKLNGSVLVQAYKFTLIILLVIHYYACIWWLVGIPSGIPGDMSWSQSNPKRPTSIDLHQQANSMQYIHSMYWVANLITVPGFADLESANFKEKTIGLFMFLSALIFFGWVTASITSLLANRDSQRSRYQQKLTSVRQFMEHNHFDPKTRQRVSNYYDYLWKRNRGIESKTIFSDLPATFQAELALGVHGHIIAKVPLFQDTDVGFIRMLSMALTPVLFLPNEFVVKKGDVGSEMFFIHKGRVDVVSEDGNQIFASMQEGSFFGEISLFLSRPRTASIRASTYTDIVVLSKQKLDEVLAFYPAVRDKIMELAQERLRENLSHQRNQPIVTPPPVIHVPTDNAAAVETTPLLKHAPQLLGIAEINDTPSTRVSNQTIHEGTSGPGDIELPTINLLDCSNPKKLLDAYISNQSVNKGVPRPVPLSARSGPLSRRNTISSTHDIKFLIPASDNFPGRIGSGSANMLTGGSAVFSMQALENIKDIGGSFISNHEILLPDKLFGMHVTGFSMASNVSIPQLSVDNFGPVGLKNTKSHKNSVTTSIYMSSNLNPHGIMTSGIIGSREMTIPESQPGTSENSFSSAVSISVPVPSITQYVSPKIPVQAPSTGQNSRRHSLPVPANVPGSHG